MSLEKKIDFVVLFSASKANPNRDPLMKIAQESIMTDSARYRMFV